MKTVFLVFMLVFIMGMSSCKKNDDKSIDSQIIGFESSKCMCCWGWIIKNGEDTIKTDSLPDIFKMDDNFPVKVKFELGSKKLNCSEFGKYDYYIIKNIERLE